MWIKIKKIIPNTLTSFNLLSGCLALVFVFQDEFEIAAYCLFLAVFFDFCDGLSARILGAYSALGVQLDSLADMVSFGVVPAAMLHRFFIKSNPDFLAVPIIGIVLYGFPFIIAIFSALRLAKFNIDARQHDSFLGLPTPANAIFIVSAILAANSCKFIGDILSCDICIILLSIVMSALLVCEIPMFSLKIKFGESQIIKKNLIQIIFLIISIILILIFGVGGISLSIVIYILYSTINVIIKINKK
jgi:CDP-diacylglycerol--serine O-phosphatidyltransferase